MVPFFNTGSCRCILRAELPIFPAVKTPNVSSWRKRLMVVDEGKMLRKVEATDLTMALDIEEDY